MEQNELSVDLIDRKRFAKAIREAMDCLDQTASCYKLTEKSYYLEVKEFLENRADHLEDINGSYLRSSEPEDRSNVCRKHLKDFTDPVLTPGDPNNCPGNGQHCIECQCDGCDHLIDCCRVPGPQQERHAPSDNPWWMKHT